MRRVLRKRIPRQLKEHFLRYLALILLTTMGMYIVVSLVDAAETIIYRTEQNQTDNHLEDGQVTLFRPFLDSELKEIEDSGVTIEEHISFEATLDNGDVLRIFRNREKIDLVVVDEGKIANNESEIVIEKRYAECNEIYVGDEIEIAGRYFTVSGIGTSVDYDAPFRKLSDTAIKSDSFGTAFVTSDAYDYIKKNGPEITEDITYAFILNDSMTEDELKDTIRDFEFDYSKVEDKYYQEMLADTYGKKEEIQDGINDLNEGAKKLVDGSNSLPDVFGEYKDGVGELADGVEELKDKSDELIDKVFSEKPDNITAFVMAKDNVRVGGAAGDVIISKQAGLVAGVIVMILFTYVLSVFVVHQIQNESSVIGALYALGVKKGDLTGHYVLLPTLVSFLGGAIGAFAGFSSIGADTQMRDSYSYYSLPVFEKIYPTYLIIYALVMPPLVSLIVNTIVINKRLNGTALSLIRNEQKAGKIRNIKLGKMGFLRRFQIRQVVRELRTGITILFGLLISLIIFMMGINCGVLCNNVALENNRDTKYEYMYTYKYPTKEVPVGGEACYMESLQKTSDGYTLDITVIGIDSDNPYFDVNPIKGQNKVVASDSVKARYGVDLGEKLVLTDNAEGKDYAFTVEEFTDYSIGIAVFMDIDSMRELFGVEDDYYNVVLSDHKLDIEEGRLYSTTSKGDVANAAQVFVDLMAHMVTVLIIASIIIFCVVMYLMLGVMIDRASFGISLVKILGYRTGEIRKLYVDGNVITVAIGAIISIPLSKVIMDIIFPSFVSNVACAIHLSFNWYYYCAIFAAIMIFYLIVSRLLMGKLNKVSPADILKNRE